MSRLHLLPTIMLSISLGGHRHCAEVHNVNLSTSYIPQMVCENYAHYEALSLRAFGPSGPNDQWFALLTTNSTSVVEPLLALDCEVQCILLPPTLPYIRTEKIVPAEVNRRLTRCTFFLQPENFMLLDPTTEWLQSIGIESSAAERNSIFGLQTNQTVQSSNDHLFYIGRSRQISQNVSQHIFTSVVSRPRPRLPLFHNQAFTVNSSRAPEVLLSSDQPSVIFGLTQVENKMNGTFCIFKIQYEQVGQLGDAVFSAGKINEISVRVSELSICIYVNVSISSGYYSEMKGLLLLATDYHQKVLFFYPLNSNTPKGHIAQVVNSMPYKDFLVCGTKKSTYAINIGVIISMAVFLLIILLVSAETIPRWRAGKGEKECKVDLKLTVSNLKTTTTAASSKTDGRENPTVTR